MISVPLTSTISALQWLDSSDRDIWIRIGMALKAEYGNSAKDVWMDWSSSYPGFKEKEANTVWRSFKFHGPIGIGTLLFLAREAGWKQDYDATPGTKHIALARQAEERRENARLSYEHSRAAGFVQQLLPRCRPDSHQYMIDRGLPGSRVLVLQDDISTPWSGEFGPYKLALKAGEMIVPMHDLFGNWTGVQRIFIEDGRWKKKMLPGMKASKSFHLIGNGVKNVNILCEGYSTGESIRLAANLLSIKCAVVITFSAHNLFAVSQLLPGRLIAIGDNDASKINDSGQEVGAAGQRACQRAGIPFAVPDVPGWDANDVHQKQGIAAVCKLIMEALNR